MTSTENEIIAAGNWKMNMLPSEVKPFFKKFMTSVTSIENTIFCVPAIDISEAISATRNLDIDIYAQNFYFQPKGAYTGEISIEMLKDAGVTGVLIGHSERREYFKESDEMINQKVIAAKNARMKIILCCGESLSQRDLEAQEAWVELQIRNDLKDIVNPDGIVIAYEPIWAIGTGKSASIDDAQNMCIHISKVLCDMYGTSIGTNVPILYGGSVNDENCEALFNETCYNGVLVGGASLKPDKFSKICNFR
ncbi:MAG: triose-phosphate isomerase [Clostridia bacterium]|nr:triose-phosphate isomerase [Clostridia bacterium]